MPAGLFLHPDRDATVPVEAGVVAHSPEWFWKMAKPVRTVVKSGTAARWHR